MVPWRETDPPPHTPEVVSCLAWDSTYYGHLNLMGHKTPWMGHLINRTSLPFSVHQYQESCIEYLDHYLGHFLVPLQDAGSKKGLSKLETYLKITRHFQPVFHHFFMEQFPYPSDWFEQRLAYTRSVATSSIGQWDSNVSRHF